MKRYRNAAFFLLSMVAACSDSDELKEAGNSGDQADMAAMYNGASEPVDSGYMPDSDCPDFSTLLALLPDRLNGEAVGEQYFSCDAVAPAASSHFVGNDEETVWTYTVTSRDLDLPPAKGRWDLPGADPSQRDFLRKGINAVISAEVVMFDNCVNTLQLAGLPEWHKTARASVSGHDVCIGTDAQSVEDAGWTARAKSPRYLYTLTVEGPRAEQFANAEQASAYMQVLFSQFR